MKGQKLYIRPATADDADAIARFFLSEGTACPPSGGEQLIGKLVGEIVAHLVYDLSEPSAVVILHIHVAARMRGKRVGRAMVEEAADVARRTGRTRLAVRKDSGPAAFFGKLGFERSDLRLEKRLPDETR